ncbi:MAG: FecR domain-containing protein [Spirochaetales bacterium]|nr:FecR domain-containing protein [Spirochaetales bacterium]
METHNKLLLLLLFICALGFTMGLLYAEESPVLLIDFYNVDIRLSDGGEVFEDELYEGYPVQVGSTIRTLEGGYAELELYDSTIIKIDEKTAFKIDEIMSAAAGDKNIFTLATGKFRAVVASVSGEDNYRFNGYSSVCGVRGTDLGMVVDSLNNVDACFVLDGAVDYTNTATGKVLQLTKDNMANTFDSVFEQKVISPEIRDTIKKGLGFRKLDPGKVKSKSKESGLLDKDKETGKDVVTDTGTTDTGEETGTGKETQGAEIPDWLKNLIGLEIGSVVIGDETYAKAILQPTIALGPFKTALYLPIIYQENIFDTDMWYKPKGNNEWSFGTDQEEVFDIAKDFVSDLVLKIKYLQWGEQRDKFWIKLGNMSDFTIGHGLIMRNYANDSEFPAIRRLGLNLGMDFEKAGFEFITNDLSEIVASPRIIGGRGFFRPFGSMAIGVSLIADLNPGADLPDEESEESNLPSAEDIGNPMFFNLGIDLDQPIIENDALRMILFADIAAMLPYFASDGRGIYEDITAGAHFEAIFPEEDDSFLRNYGAMAGMFGNILFIDYELDFRFFTGTFRPQFFDTGYDAKSSNYALETAQYIMDPENEKWDSTTMGIYMQGGYTLDKIFSIELGYMLPMTISDLDGFEFLDGEDTFHAKLSLFSEVIPVVDISGSISYSRTYFYRMLAGKLSPTNKMLDWFDEYTSLNGEIVYAINDYFDLAGIFSTAVARDPETGDVLYEDDGITMKIVYSMGIETRIHY